MHSRWLLLPAASLSLFLASCTNGTGPLANNNPAGTGPFDSRGNYIEAWADNPSAWRKGNNQVVEAEPDRPAATDIPVTAPPVIAANESPKPITTTTTVVYKKPTPSPVVKVTPKPTVAKTTTKSTTSKATTAKSTPKAKTSTKKATVKAKPKSTRHTVKSGDNLYNIAKRYGTSVSAIQKANGTKGSMIRPGQALVIPR